MATSGPVPPTWSLLADAHMDWIPVVAITGQAGGLIGTDAFQEADISGITMPITKHNFLVRDGDDIARVLAEAFHIAASGRPVRSSSISPRTCRASARSAGRREIELPGYKPNTKPHNRQVREAAKLIGGGPQPVLYVGGGVIRGEATEQLLDLAELTASRRHHADGPRRFPGQPSAEHGMPACTARWRRWPRCSAVTC